MARTKVRVTMNALVQRINRRLRPDNEVLRKTRGMRASLDLGDWYILDVNRNFVIHHHVDPEALGRKLNVLAGFEVLASEDDQ